MKEEALSAFKESVKEGWSIKDCICRVQNEVLPKVPKERNKFFIKFTYDNQLQIEIGVNKFKNGNAQFYHRLGVAPKESPEMKEHNEIKEKKREAMEELQNGGSFPSIKLKPQVTNDKSAPFVSGKVSNPSGGWDEFEDLGEDAPPNPTNMQTARARTGWEPYQRQARAAKPRVLGDLFRQQKPKPSQLRCRSVGRPQKEELGQYSSEARDRDRSISPMGPRGRGRGRGALGDCFRTGIRPSKAMLRPVNTSQAHKEQERSSQRFTLEREDKENLNDNMMKHIKIQVEKQKQHPIEESDSDEEWNENCVEIEEMSSTDEEIEDTSSSPSEVSCEQKRSIFITEPIPETTYKVSQPGDHDFKKIETPFFDENPLPNLKRFHMPDQSLFTKKINPLPPLEDLDGWHGPVLERTRTVPKKCFGKLEISCQSKPSNNNNFNTTSKEMDSRTGQGWISIPIQRL